ncbi:MAG: hypothetical protein QGG64_02975, partial [Candidatus Latescibacteria bacterium]|nr:hypothetical protein [Candidatus Latescibacterota bacterium]
MATQMLLLDYALAPPVVNEGIAFYFANAGCTVHYRQFYPNLVRSDLENYNVIALLSGRTPAFPSGMMSIHEVALVVEFVQGGGTLILGPNLEGGEGANERHLFNRVLAALGICIRIDNTQVEDPVNQYAGTLGERPLYCSVSEHPINKDVAERLAFDRSTVLQAGPGASVPLTTFDTEEPYGVRPVVALGKSGKGH